MPTIPLPSGVHQSRLDSLVLLGCYLRKCRQNNKSWALSIQLLSYRNFREKRTTSRGMPQFSKLSYRKFQFYLISLPEFPFFWVEWIAPLINHGHVCEPALNPDCKVDSGKWFEPRGISYWFFVIFRVRIVFRKTVVVTATLNPTRQPTTRPLPQQ